MKWCHIQILPVLILLAGCRHDQFNQPKSNPLRESDTFSDGADSRPLPEHVVAHDESPVNASFYSGVIGTNPITEFPVVITRSTLEHGKERFEITCAPCHGFTGEGNGVVVQRGFPAPPSYAIDRLRAAPVGHFVNVMAQGYGAMFPQTERVTPEDRWAIAAYIRALQFSEHAPLSSVPMDKQSELTSTP